MPYSTKAFTSEWMRLAEAAGPFGCHPNTIKNRINSGKITGVRMIRLDGVIRVHRDDWARYVASRTVVAQQAA